MMPRADVDNDSMLATNWLEHTREVHPLLDILFGKDTFCCFAMGDLCLAYENFYTGITSYFTQMHGAHVTIAWTLYKKFNSSRK